MSELCDTLAAVELPVPKEFQPLMILASPARQLYCNCPDARVSGKKTRPVAHDQYDHG